MPPQLAKLMPTAALIVILGYLSWSYLEMAPSALNSANKMPEIAASLLKPAAPPVTERDPFGNSVAFELGEFSTERRGQHKPAKTAGGPKPKESPRATQVDGQNTAKPEPAKTVTATTSTLATKEATAVNARSTAAAPTTKTAAVANTANENLLTEFVLNATLLHGDQQLALINGRVYRPGESLGDASSETRYLVAEIHHHRVVLDHEGQLVNLQYRDQPAAGKPGRSANTKNNKTGRAGATSPRQPGAPPAR